MRRSVNWLLTSFLLTAAACGTGGTASDVDAPPGTIDASGSGTPDGGIPAGYVKLIGRTWSLTAGQTDTYKCVRVQVPADMYIGGFLAIAPQGTHHTVLTVSTTSKTVGEYDCNAGALDFQMLFASGLGTPQLEFPDGIGMKLAAGTYINLNLHLFDATDHALSGETDIYVKTLATAPDTAHTAEMIFSGTAKINITATADIMQPFSGGCVLPATPAAENLIALWPHEHQLGVHQLVTDTPSGGQPTTLLDNAYSFSEQKTYPWATPMVVHGGDRIETTCTYVNNTNPIRAVTFGESSLDEMCFTGIYRYPAVAGSYLFQCVDDGQLPGL
jgi:hypothetical protein